MNRCLQTWCRTFVVILTVGLLSSISAAQPQGYRAPNFAGMAMQAGGGAGQMPTFPASLLAGGPAAAQGGEFVDVQGRSIQLTNYSQSYPDSGYGNGCPTGFCGPGGPGGGDPMAVDFGGYGQDQCGPHYFDVQIGTVFLQSEGAFGDVQAFTSVSRGLNAPRALDVANSNGGYEAGWEIAARYDIGALAVLEATYMGIYDMGFSESVSSPEQPPAFNNFLLFSPFSNFGTIINGDIAGIDNGQTHAIDYQADLQSTEFNYRRYWVGHNPRVSGTFLVGARYLRFTDDVTFNSTGFGAPELATASLNWSGENDLVGGQCGGDAWVCLRQGLRIGVEGTAGIYNNRFKFANSGTFSAATGPDDFAGETEGNQVAFASEVEVSMVADILPSWSLRGGYRVLYIDRLATGAGNINQSTLAVTVGTPDGNLLFHGFHGGLEYVW